MPLPAHWWVRGGRKDFRTIREKVFEGDNLKNLMWKVDEKDGMDCGGERKLREGLLVVDRNEKTDGE